MKKVLSLLAVTALVASTALMGADEKKYKEGGCCAKAKKAGKVCSHPCCVEAEKKGEVCKKCNE